MVSVSSRMPLVTRDTHDALVFDLDGTLLDGRGEVTPRTKAAVARARAAGYVVLLATGRSLSGTRGVHAALGLDTPVVAYNGAWVGPTDGGDPWHYAPIPDALVSAVGGAERRARFAFRHQRESKFTRRAGCDEHRRLVAWYTNVVEVDGEPAALPASDLLRFSLFYAGPDDTEEAWQALPEEARETLHREVFPLSIFPDFADVSLHLCEVQRRGRGKAEACRWLEESRGIPPERVVAVGDQCNDVPLLRAAGLAVVMGNGVPAARAEADLVIGDHREEGLARFLDDHVA
jgi:Cof subfamily protein (haloacid dehalogenase superfamily)